jgi:hypothetical protein
MLMRRHAILSSRPLPGLLAALFACGDPTFAPAQGAASLEWNTSLFNGKTPQCVPLENQTGPHWSNAPPSPMDEPLVSATGVTGGYVVNGESGAVVNCSVVAQGEAYVVTGEIQATSADGSLYTDVAINVTLDNLNVAQGTLYITDQLSVVTFSSDTAIVPPKPGCTFQAQAVGGVPGVQPGHLYANVACGHINDNRNRAAQECEIQAGFIVLENCIRE